jgi:hypothetical protein
MLKVNFWSLKSLKKASKGTAEIEAQAKQRLKSGVKK